MAPPENDGHGPQETWRLRRQFHDAMADSMFDRTFSFRFLPEGAIDTLVAKSNLKHVRELPKRMRGGSFNEEDPVMSFILTKARRLFLIAIDVGLEYHDLWQAMKLFKAKSITDANIPLKEEMLDGLTRMDKALEVEGCSIYLTNNDSSGSDDEREEIWNKANINDFLQYQWKFNAAVFSLGKDNHDLYMQSILPFTEKCSGFGGGSYGEVSKYRIHKSHLVDPEDPEFICPDFVAVKEMKVRVSQNKAQIVHSWENEVKVLGKMNSLKEPHIVRFFTAFRRGDPDPGFEDHYLMLEWADGGNLRDLWRSLSRPKLTLPLVKATMTQLRGLADAIRGAHYPVDGPNYRHGDLKPENILWFKSNGDDGIGTLKIGDWGLAKEQMVVTELRTNRTTTPPGTRLYEPPEEVVGFGNDAATLTPSTKTTKRRSRLCDIWSMGCITLEFLIWLMYGQTGLNMFIKELKGNLDNARFYQNKTRKDERDKLPFQVHDVVVKWMKHMSVDPVCEVGQTALGELLNLIETRLLVVQLPQGYGTMPNQPTSHSQPQLVTRSSNNKLERKDDSPVSVAAGPNPAIIVSAVEPGNLPISKQILSEPEGLNEPRASGGNKRARAPDFADGMFDIFSDDPPDRFWLRGQPGPPPGVDSSDSIWLGEEGATQTGDTIVQSHASDTERLKDSGRLDVTGLSTNRTEKVG